MKHRLPSLSRFGRDMLLASRGEGPILIIFLLVATAVWGFVELAGEVVEGSTEAFDRTILLALRNPGDLSDPLGPEWFEEMMRDFTALGGLGVLSLLTAAAVGYLLLTGKRHAALVVLLSIVCGIVLSSLIKLGFYRPRPDLVPHGSYVYTASFPSGHSLMSAVVYLSLGALVARVQQHWHLRLYILAVAVVLSLIIGFSRIYLGVHWPTDVLGGWTAGAAWALLCWFVTLWLQRQGNVESDADQIAGRPSEQ